MENPDKNKPMNFFTKLLNVINSVFKSCSKLLDRIVFHKTGSIVISLLLAIAICVAIDYEDIRTRFFKDDSVTVEVRDVNVETLIDADQYSVEGMPSQVDVSLVGDSTSIQVFRQQGNVVVVADMRESVEGVNSVDLSVQNLPSNITAVVTPATVETKVSKKTTKQFMVQTDLIVGAGQKTSDFETPTLSTNTVYIKASQDKINSIRTVKAIVDATGQVGSFETEATIAAYDAKGNKVAVELNPTTIHATVKLKEKSSE